MSREWAIRTGKRLEMELLRGGLAVIREMPEGGFELEVQSLMRLVFKRRYATRAACKGMLRRYYGPAIGKRSRWREVE